MTSAFPSTSQADPFSTASFPRDVPERGTFIPGAYMRNPHRNPGEVVVKQNGVPILGTDGKEFTVAQVAPERRWAIGYDGEIMHQYDFNNNKKEHIHEYFDMIRANGRPDAKYLGNPDREPMPDVKDYCSWCVDPRDSKKVLQIGYDPDENLGKKPEKFWDSSGEEIEKSRIELLCEAYASPKHRKSLREEEIIEVREHLKNQGVPDAGDIADKLEMLTNLLNDKSLTMEDYGRAVSALTGKVSEAEPVKAKVAPAPIPEVPEKDKPTEALCGKPNCKGIRGKLAHERQCKKCKVIAEGVDGTTSVA